MMFDSTVTLGNIISLVVLLAGIFAGSQRLLVSLDRRLALFEHTIQEHARMIASHASHLEKQDGIMLEMVGDVQRLIGRFDAMIGGPVKTRDPS